jgi:signal transduction histidine kinase
MGRGQPAWNGSSAVGRAWHWVLPACVALALIAVAAIDLVVESRIDPRQTIIQSVANPALAVSTDIQLTLARRMSAIRGYIATGEPRFVDRLERLKEEERAHFTRLTALSRGLDSTVAARVDQLGTATDRWDEAIDASGIMARFAPGLDASLTTIVLDQQLYDQALDASLRLEEAIRESAAGLNAEIAVLDRTADRISYGLLLLALAGAAGVSLLGYRMRGLNSDLAQRQHDLESVTHSRARLIRGFSHDLKNPLGAADGHAALLETGIPGPLSGGQQESVHRIRATLRSAFHLIEELVELGRVETGQLEIRPAAVKPEEILQKVAAEYRPQADRANLELIVERSDPVGEIRTDPTRLEQILGNLVSNAIKYTETGGVRIGARYDAPSARPRWIHLFVEDTGVGVPPESVELVFEEFSRLRASSVPGAGLGLAISSRIARALGGEITVVSEPGCGSTFTLSLPVEYPGSP